MRHLLWILLAAACARGSDGPSLRPAPAGGDGTLSVLGRGARPPLAGPRVEGATGSWVLGNGQRVATVSSTGTILDFAAPGARDGLVSLKTTAFVALAEVPSEVRTLQRQGNALYIVRRMLTEPASIHSWVFLEGKVLTIVSEIQAAPGARLPTLGEVVRWGNTPGWVEGHGRIREAGAYGGRFIGATSLGVSYAMCRRDGRLLARFAKPSLPGFHPNPTTGERLFPAGAPIGRRRVVHLAVGATLSEATLDLPCSGARPSGAIQPTAPLPRGAWLEARHCGVRSGVGVPFLRSAIPQDRRVALPRGCSRVRFGAPGYAPGPWLKPSEALRPGPKQLPAAGIFEYRVTAGAHPLPSRLRVEAAGGGAPPTWGEDPDRGAALNVIYSETGTGRRPLPPGRYRVSVDRGFEYSAVTRELEIRAGKTTRVEATLRRVVDTTGWLSADLHLHSVASPDAPQPFEDRIRSLVAVGVEVGVATEHNRIADYRPTIKRMKLERWVASVVGDEITTKDLLLGHFNVFPWSPHRPPVPWRHTTPSAIFAAIRAAGGPRKIIQVNHPRMEDIGYFNLMHLDPVDIAGSLRRSPQLNLRFDAIEVFNGDHYDQRPRVVECVNDWFALLNAGYRHAATGNSDSHKLTYHEAGVPRNLVYVGKDDPAAFEEKRFIEAVRGARIVVTSGPFIELSANGKRIGSEVKAGEVEVAVRVQAPSWVDVDRVQVIVRGRTAHEWRGPFRAGSERLKSSVRLKLARGDWIVAVAQGSKPMTLLHRPGALPYSFTNPIWVR